MPILILTSQQQMKDSAETVLTLMASIGCGPVPRTVILTQPASFSLKHPTVDRSGGLESITLATVVKECR